MIETVMICREGRGNTSLSVKREDGSWTHNVILPRQELQLLRDYLLFEEGSRRGWAFNFMYVGENFLWTSFKLRPNPQQARTLEWIQAPQ